MMREKPLMLKDYLELDSYEESCQEFGSTCWQPINSTLSCNKFSEFRFRMMLPLITSYSSNEGPLSRSFSKRLKGSFWKSRKRKGGDLQTDKSITLSTTTDVTEVPELLQQVEDENIIRHLQEEDGRKDDGAPHSSLSPDFHQFCNIIERVGPRQLEKIQQIALFDEQEHTSDFEHPHPLKGSNEDPCSIGMCSMMMKAEVELVERAGWWSSPMREEAELLAVDLADGVLSSLVHGFVTELIY